MEIEFDPDEARKNLRKHQINLADAEQALRDPLALTKEDPDSRDEQRFITLGTWHGYLRKNTRCSVHLSRRHYPADLCSKSEQG